MGISILTAYSTKQLTGLFTLCLACSVTSLYVHVSDIMEHSTFATYQIPSSASRTTTAQTPPQPAVAQKPKSAASSDSKAKKPATAEAPTKTPATSVAPSSSGSDIVNYARSRNSQYFGEKHWPALYALWNSESNWRPNAVNPTSGACGIPQALPCSKIPNMSPQGQVDWGLEYIKHRYETPSKAWAFWQRNGWY